MHVYRDHVYCFSCRFTADVVGVWQLEKNFERPIEAALDLARELHIELPATEAQRRLSRKEDHRKHKEAIRAKAIKSLARRYQERMVKVFAPSLFVNEEPELEDLEELERFSREIWTLCVAWAHRRMDDVSK